MSDYYSIRMLPGGLWLYEFGRTTEGVTVRSVKKATQAIALNLDSAEAVSSLLHTLGFDNAVVRIPPDVPP